MLLDCLPHDLLIDPKIIMDKNVSHRGNLPPWDRRVALPGRRIDGAHSLANDHQVVDHPHLDEGAALERRSPHGLLGFDVRDGFEDVLQAVAELPHNGMASRRTRSRRRGLRPSSVTKSTRQLSKSCSSSSKPPRSSSEQPGRVFISTSTSLASVLSPRATEPNTRTSPAWYRLARERISSRLCIRVLKSIIALEDSLIARPRKGVFC